jgi:hypothetical protein
MCGKEFVMTQRENYLIAARGGKPEWVPCFPEDCNIFMPDFWNETDPITGADLFNVKWIENEYGRMPDEKYHAMDAISQWRATAKFPDPATMDWEGMHKRYLENYDPDKVNIVMLNTNGIFLIPVNMLGWVEALVAIYEDREELEAFVSAITDFLVSLVPYICRYFKPDIIFSGDDLAATNGPFISRETWSSLYKPYFKQIYNTIHSYGVLGEFHCCGNCQYLIEEFLDVGVDICQLPMPNESLLKDKKHFGNRLVITGGWDRHGSGAMPGASEQVVRQSVHHALDTWGKDGALIFWDGGIAGRSEDSNNKMQWLYDEFHAYGKEIYRQA